MVLGSQDTAAACSKPGTVSGEDVSIDAGRQGAAAVEAHQAG